MSLIKGIGLETTSSAILILSSFALLLPLLFRASSLNSWGSRAQKRKSSKASSSLSSPSSFILPEPFSTIRFPTQQVESPFPSSDPVSLLLVSSSMKPKERKTIRILLFSFSPSDGFYPWQASSISAFSPLLRSTKERKSVPTGIIGIGAQRNARLFLFVLSLLS